MANSSLLPKHVAAGRFVTIRLCQTLYLAENEFAIQFAASLFFKSLLGVSRLPTLVRVGNRPVLHHLLGEKYRHAFALTK